MAKVLYIGSGGRMTESPLDVSTAGVLTLPAINNPTLTAGSLGYDSQREALVFRNNQSAVTMDIGQENWVRVFNATGSTIANGAACYINGADAGTGLPTIALAQANAGATTLVVGLATHSIPTGTIGYVTSFGAVRNLDTSLFAAGGIFLSPTVAGGLTQTVPNYPNYRFRVGTVSVVNATTGVINVQLGQGTIGVDFGTGQAGGQTVIGGNAASENLTLSSTANATKGKIIFGSLSAYDEANDRLGLGTISPASKLVVQQSANGLGLLMKAPAGAIADLSLATENIFGGLYWTFLTTSRLDFQASQMFFTANNGISFQSKFLVGRQGDSTSIATQKSSYTLAQEAAVWNGTQNIYRYNGFQTISSTSVQGLHRLALLVNGTDNALAAGVEMASWSSNGLIKTGGSPVGSNTDIANSTVSMADATGISFPVLANTLYYFYFIYAYNSAATATGAQFSLNTAATPTYLAYHGQLTLTGTTTSAFEGQTAVNTPATFSATSLTAGNIAFVEGFIKCSNAGTVIGRFASEVAASAITIKAAMVDFKAVA